MYGNLCNADAELVVGGFPPSVSACLYSGLGYIPCLYGLPKLQFGEGDNSFV